MMASLRPRSEPMPSAAGTNSSSHAVRYSDGSTVGMVAKRSTPSFDVSEKSVSVFLRSKSLNAIAVISFRLENLLETNIPREIDTGDHTIPNLILVDTRSSIANVSGFDCHEQPSSFRVPTNVSKDLSLDQFSPQIRNPLSRFCGCESLTTIVVRMRFIHNSVHRMPALTSRLMVFASGLMTFGIT